MPKLHRVESLMARPTAWPIHREAVRLIALEEDCRLTSYLCDAGVWTCGWGETSGVKPAMRWTQEHADARFLASLTEYAAAVEDMLKVPTTAEQKGALVSLAYNIGLAGLRGSTVMRLHNKGDFEGAARAFGLWNKAKKNGKLQPHPVLIARRATETALYLRRDPEAPSVRPVQAVAPESSLVASPIAQSGAGIVGAGVLTALPEIGAHVGTVKTVATEAKALATDTLGIPEGWFLPAVLVVVGGVVLWQRYRQRAGGWA